MVTLRLLQILFLSFQLVYGNSNTRSATQTSCDAEIDSLPAIPIDPFPEYDPHDAAVYRYRKQHGVNFGSMYVHEHWMTPSVFACAAGQQASEIDIASGWNSTKRARAVLENHWNTFISESDFAYLADIGINTIRLPIGYWSLGPQFCQGTPFSPYADVYTHSWAYIVRTINMAAKYGLGVLVDLHGAVGSQNGQPHSGISDHQVGLFDSSSNQQKTLDVLVFLIKQLCTVTNIVGIQLLNEPVDVPQLSQFYSRALTTMRQTSTCAQTFPLYIHDGFNLQEFSDFVGNRTDFVVEDHHSYFVFTPEDGSKPASQLTKEVETSVASSLATASAKQRDNLIVGEWSGALTPQSLSFTQDQEEARRNFSFAQMEVYSTTSAGWIFWSYRLENCDADSDPSWCFIAAAGTTLPSTFTPYPNGCQLSGSSGSLLGRSLRSTPLHPFHHRQNTISDRRSTSKGTSTQQSSSKGYSDGFSAARLFCNHGGSTLGFVGQYIDDSVKSYGPNAIQPGAYSEGFYRGLSDGEVAEGRPRR